MTPCIKCGKQIPDGELFCKECNSLPVIADLNASEPSKVTIKPDGRKRTAVKAPPKPKPKKKPQQKKKQPQSALFVPFIIVCVLLVGTLSLLLWQRGDLRKERNRIRTIEASDDAQISALKGRLQILSGLEEELETTKLLLEEKEAEITELSAQLAESQSSQSQGEYDMSNLQRELNTLQEEYDLLLADYEAQATELETAKGYKEKADFLDRYAVFVHTEKDTYYHKYSCSKFTKKSFLTYSPKLAEKLGFKPCPECCN